MGKKRGKSMQKSKSKETTQLSNDTFGLMIDRAKYGDNEALLKVIEEMKPEIESLAGFLKLPKQYLNAKVTLGISNRKNF
ncbi:hypothetical protein EN829_038280 [Mesorhizobium sp. M00.F.Ca.ET.186.01.1.1]|nr:hypothetical protein EN829_038280 [Mesorhizobium sp. M00.F.Ca.ET.186.01.1.1]